MNPNRDFYFIFAIEKGFYIPSGSKIQILFTIRTMEITHITKKATP
jgi:hypothetical protein